MVCGPVAENRRRIAVVFDAQELRLAEWGCCCFPESKRRVSRLASSKHTRALQKWLRLCPSLRSLTE